MARKDDGINSTERRLRKIAKIIEGKKRFTLKTYMKLEPLLAEAHDRCRKAITYYSDKYVRLGREIAAMRRDLKKRARKSATT